MCISRTFSPAIQLHDNLASSVVVNKLKLSNVACKVMKLCCQQPLSGLQAGCLCYRLKGNPPWRIMTCRNLMTTLEEGLSNTCRFPRFSALYSAPRPK